MSLRVSIIMSRVLTINVFSFFFVELDNSFINEFPDEHKCLMMDKTMFSSVIAKIEVFNSVIRLLSVNVVDDFFFGDSPANILLHNKSTSFFVSAIDSNIFISSVKELSSKFNWFRLEA